LASACLVRSDGYHFDFDHQIGKDEFLDPDQSRSRIRGGEILLPVFDDFRKIRNIGDVDICLDDVTEAGSGSSKNLIQPLEDVIDLSVEVSGADDLPVFSHGDLAGRDDQVTNAEARRDAVLSPGLTLGRYALWLSCLNHLPPAFRTVPARGFARLRSMTHPRRG